jgi:hypothetical protein
MSNNLGNNTTVFDEKYINDILIENQTLKIKLFWKDYNLNKLKEAMRFANIDGIGPKCACLACAVTGRKDDEANDSDPWVCTFKPWFEEQMKSLQMTVEWSRHQNRNDFHDCLNGDVETNCGNASIWDDESHFAHFSSRDDWHWFTYGSKLWSATSIEDPELAKLKSLFKILYTENDEDKD